MRRTILALAFGAALGCAAPRTPADDPEPAAQAPGRNVSVEEITIIVAGAD